MINLHVSLVVSNVLPQPPTPGSDQQSISICGCVSVSMLMADPDDECTWAKWRDKCRTSGGKNNGKHKKSIHSLKGLD